jgi:hypothetical protein
VCLQPVRDLLAAAAMTFFEVTDLLRESHADVRMRAGRRRAIWAPRAKLPAVLDVGELRIEGGESRGRISARWRLGRTGWLVKLRKPDSDESASSLSTAAAWVRLRISTGQQLDSLSDGLREPVPPAGSWDPEHLG